MRSPRLPPRATLIAAGVSLSILLISIVAAARPGGGHSYSGGSSHSSSGGGSHSSGGGGDGGAGLFYLILLCIEHPVIGIPLLIIVVAFYVIKTRMSGSGSDWSTANDSGNADERRAMPAAREQSFAVTRSMLDQLRAADPDFSVVLFEDFVYTLYGELHRSRAQAASARLSPYVAPGALGALGQNAALREVRGIVIGAMRCVWLTGGSTGQATTVEIEFEANYGEVTQSGERRLYVVERMTLVRAAGARSRPPARARTLDCPNCGAPLENVRGDQCSYCKKSVGGGRFDWFVTQFRRSHTEPRGPLLGGDVAEQGNNLRTVADPQAPARVDQLRARDPSFDWNQFQGRIGLIFQSLQVAWSSREWLRARPFVSDNLFQSQMYWIDLYIQQRARNVTENARVVQIQLASVISDKYFDAITVRVWATGLDYTVTDDGRMLGGSRTKERPYSEYWTLIRGSERANKPTTTAAACPNCGAPLAVSMTGNCNYCRVKVTTGEFDWVLSRIEQDESYGG